MKKWFNWQVLLGLVLLLLSAVTYGVHYLIFRDAHHILIYLVGDIAFVFLEVLLVTLILHRLLQLHERQDRLKKMNMVIGVFFSEVGHDLLRRLSSFDQKMQSLHEAFLIRQDFSQKEWDALRQRLRGHAPAVSAQKGDLEGLKQFLADKRSFLLDLLRNGSLLEHESFTDVLWAVFHLTEELHFRTSLKTLPSKDLNHLSGDINRAMMRLMGEWIRYLQHLQEDYPYLFSLAVRINPFDGKASVVLKD